MFVKINGRIDDEGSPLENDEKAQDPEGFPEPQPDGPCHAPASAEATGLQPVRCMTLEILAASSKCVVALEH
jgi:hypothetical protein